jgi:ABC-type branched-subunit amino acid transport system substrate-binding protein
MTHTPTTVAWLAENLEGHRETLETAKLVFADRGVDVVYEAYLEYGTPDYSPVITALQAANPDLVYWGLYQEDAGRFAKQARLAGYEPTMGYISIYAEVQSLAFQDPAGGIEYALNIPSTGSLQLRDTYQRGYTIQEDWVEYSGGTLGELTTTGLPAYDSIYVLAYALPKAFAKSPEISQSVAFQSALIEEIRAIDDLELSQGTTRFDANGQAILSVAMLEVLADGTTKLLGVPDPDEVYTFVNQYLAGQ